MFKRVLIALACGILTLTMLQNSSARAAATASPFTTSLIKCPLPDRLTYVYHYFQVIIKSWVVIDTTTNIMSVVGANDKKISPDVAITENAPFVRGDESDLSFRLQDGRRIRIIRFADDPAQMAGIGVLAGPTWNNAIFLNRCYYDQIQLNSHH